MRGIVNNSHSFSPLLTSSHLLSPLLSSSHLFGMDVRIVCHSSGLEKAYFARWISSQWGRTSPVMYSVSSTASYRRTSADNEIAMTIGVRIVDVLWVGIWKSKSART